MAHHVVMTVKEVGEVRDKRKRGMLSIIISRKNILFVVHYIFYFLSKILLYCSYSVNFNKYT